MNHFTSSKTCYRQAYLNRVIPTVRSRYRLHGVNYTFSLWGWVDGCTFICGLPEQFPTGYVPLQLDQEVGKPISFQNEATVNSFIG